MGQVVTPLQECPSQDKVFSLSADLLPISKTELNPPPHPTAHRRDEARTKAPRRLWRTAARGLFNKPSPRTERLVGRGLRGAEPSTLTIPSTA